MPDISVFLKEASYTGTEFADELKSSIEAAIVTAGGTATVDVVYDGTTRKLSFVELTVGVPNITFMIDSSQVGNGSYVSDTLMWEAMGFTDISADIVLSEDPLAPTTAPEMVKIPKDPYLIMEITFPRIMRGRMRSTGEHREVFAKISFDRAPGEFFGSIYQFVSLPVVFHKIMRLERIGFRFLRPNGDLYDMHNQEHSFAVEFITG